MYALMIAFLSVCIVGAAVTLRGNSEATDLIVSEKVIAASFNRYANAVRCYARANPSAQGRGPTIAVLKAASYQGVPCLISGYVPITVDSGSDGIFKSWITPAEVVVYSSSKEMFRNLPPPTSALYQYAGSRYERVGVVAPDQESILSAGGGVVGTLPPSLLAAGVDVRPAVGAAVHVAYR